MLIKRTLFFLSAASIMVVLAGCGGGGGIGTASYPTDKTPPGKVTNLTATSNDGDIILSWTNPADSDFHRIHFSKTFAYESASDTITFGFFYIDIIGANSYSDEDLISGVEYKYTAYAIDYSGNYSEGVTVYATATYDAFKVIGVGR